MVLYVCTVSNEIKKLKKKKNDSIKNVNIQFKRKNEIRGIQSFAIVPAYNIQLQYLLCTNSRCVRCSIETFVSTVYYSGH